MLVGYNTNVPFRGKMYHIQTEDSGLKNPVIITLLYHKGTILASKKTDYADVAGSPDYKEKVRELMKEQHKAMMKELIRGIHTGEGTAGAEEKRAVAEQMPAADRQEPKAQISRSLDDILLDFIMKREK